MAATASSLHPRTQPYPWMSLTTPRNPDGRTTNSTDHILNCNALYLTMKTFSVMYLTFKNNDSSLSNEEKEVLVGGVSKRFADLANIRSAE